MNKIKAREWATRQINAGTLTVGHLRQIIAATPGSDRRSNVNAGLTKSVALEILFRAIAGRPDDEVVGREMPTRDTLMATNIAWECL